MPKSKDPSVPEIIGALTLLNSMSFADVDRIGRRPRFKPSNPEHEAYSEKRKKRREKRRAQKQARKRGRKK